MWWLDSSIYQKITLSHPYVVGLSIVLGLTEFGLQGAILGPLLICATTAMLKMCRLYLVHFGNYEAVIEQAKQHISNSESPIRSGRQRIAVTSHVGGGGGSKAPKIIRRSPSDSIVSVPDL